MAVVRPEQWYMVWWAVMGVVYLSLQLIGTYFVVKWAILSTLTPK